MENREFIEIKHLPDAVMVINCNGSILKVNTHAEKLFGYERGMFTGLTIDALIPEKYRKRHKNSWTGLNSSRTIRWHD